MVMKKKSTQNWYKIENVRKSVILGKHHTIALMLYSFWRKNYERIMAFYYTIFLLFHSLTSSLFFFMLKFCLLYLNGIFPPPTLPSNPTPHSF